MFNIRAQKCSEAFWRPRESHSMTIVGAWAEVYIAQSCRWKGRSLNCPETRWREVDDSQQSRRVTTCTIDKAVSDEDFDGESTTILLATGRGVCYDKKEVRLSQRLTDGVEAGLRQLATDCLRVFRYNSFEAFNLGESVSLSVIFFSGNFADVIPLYIWLTFIDLSSLIHCY